MPNNKSTILSKIPKNDLYASILDKFDNCYFSQDFNLKVDTLLSKYTNLELIKHYLGYKRLCEKFLSIDLTSDLSCLASKLKIDVFSQENAQLVFLLIYKEIDFFCIKIESLLNIDCKLFDVVEYEDFLKICLNDEESVVVNKKDINFLEEAGLRYYFSEKKIRSFFIFITNSLNSFVK